MEAEEEEVCVEEGEEECKAAVVVEEEAECKAAVVVEEEEAECKAAVVVEGLVVVVVVANTAEEEDTIEMVLKVTWEVEVATEGTIAVAVAIKDTEDNTNKEVSVVADSNKVMEDEADSSKFMEDKADSNRAMVKDSKAIVGEEDNKVMEVGSRDTGAEETTVEEDTTEVAKTMGSRGEETIVIGLIEREECFGKVAD